MGSQTSDSGEIFSKCEIVCNIEMDNNGAKFVVVGEKGVGNGRFVRCTDAISSGELVLTESALVTGPKLSHLLVCVQCLRCLGSVSLCQSCGLPLCLQCQSCDHPHLTSHSQECHLLTRHGVVFHPSTPTQAKLLLP